MSNQIGAATGIAAAALTLGYVDSPTPVGAFQTTFWLLAIALLVMLAAGAALPGRPAPRPQDVAVPVGGGQAG
ncbi:hypothetical protein [Nonomuraea sp. LPB2021202275-12-8]|uniref:hypothetical protein n=1 Tax=Nonomuraea sp. LPB2021202275-12-8 TaxID=3120159 RepID=UPI00300CE534